jgi:hypothetical protein
MMSQIEKQIRIHPTRQTRFAPSIIARACGFTNAGVWAFGAAWIVWLAINMPAFTQARATAELRHAQENANEDRIYCEKWGMPAGTPQHSTCLRDLGDLRAKVEHYAYDQVAGIL